MKPTIEIYVGGPTSGTEASALSQLVEKLSDLGEPCLIFANFLCGPKKRQVDYFVVTSSRAAHLELKHCLGPIEAPGEGAWFYKPMGGHRTRIPTSDGSPRRQAINTKYAISDAMEQFAVRNSDVPPPSGKYFKTFESAVCIYPTIQPGSVVDPGDRLARVWSFENCVNSIGGQAAVHKWPWEVWRRFADHLRLEKVTLPAAISPEVYRAKADLDALCSLQAAYFAERVYVIQNIEGRFYIGMTTDLTQRLSDHRNAVSKWTKHRGPWTLIWSQQCPTIGEARKLENKLKRQGRGSGFYCRIMSPDGGVKPILRCSSGSS